MPQGRQRPGSPDVDQEQRSAVEGFMRIAGSSEEVLRLVESIGLTAVSVMNRPPGFVDHWRVQGGGGKILYFSRRAGRSSIYLSRNYLHAWEEIKDLAHPTLFGRGRRH